MKKAYYKLLQRGLVLLGFGATAYGCVRTGSSQYECLYGPPLDEYQDSITSSEVDTVAIQVTPEKTV